MIKYAGILALALAASSAHAETTHENWTSKSVDGRCFAVTHPARSEGEIAGRNAPYLAIQNVPSEGVRGAVAIVSGSVATVEGDVKVAIDGKEFEVLAFQDSAFAASGQPEAALVTALRRGHELTATWTSKDGNAVTDTYDLKGFTAAKAAVDADCR